MPSWAFVKRVWKSHGQQQYRNDSFLIYDTHTRKGGGHSFLQESNFFKGGIFCRKKRFTRDFQAEKQLVIIHPRLHFLVMNFTTFVASSQDAFSAKGNGNLKGEM